MKFIELTEIHGSKIIVNFDHVKVMGKTKTSKAVDATECTFIGIGNTLMDETGTIFVKDTIESIKVKLQ